MPESRLSDLRQSRIPARQAENGAHADYLLAYEMASVDSFRICFGHRVRERPDWDDLPQVSRPLKLTLVVAGVVLGLVVLVSLAVVLLVNKPRLEAVASEALGMDVDIGGRTGIDVFPTLHVTLEDVRVRNRGVDFVSVGRADFEIDRLPLLSLKVRFKRIALERYRISIERDAAGKFNYELDDPERVLPALDPVPVSLSDGTLHYAATQSGTGFEATDCDLDVTHMSHPGGKAAELFKRLSITMTFVCAEMQKDKVVWSDLQGTLDGSDGVFEFEPVTMLVFGGQGSGSVHVDRTGPVPLVHVRYSLLQLRIEEFLKLLSPEKAAHGPMDLTMDLTMQGSTSHDLRQTAQGDVSLVGENLALDGRDLDQELARYDSSQHFNLVDVGALFLAGPLGLAVTKGYNFASLFRGPGGTTPISTLVSKWKVEQGVAHATDVAFATQENRLALHGGLDFVNEEFADVTVAVVDPSGCPQVLQKIVGPFQKPVLEKPAFLKSMAGPTIKLFRKMFPGTKCEVFYEGSLAAPEPPSKHANRGR